MAISTTRLTIAIALILGLISAVLYVTTQNMHVSGLRNELVESPQGCANPRECTPSAMTSPNIRSVILFANLIEGDISDIDDRI